MATAENDLLQSLDSFSAEEFEQVVLVNVSQHKRNPALWDALLSRQLIDRTHGALAIAFQRNSAAMSARRPNEPSETSGTDPGYKEWRRGAVSFNHLVQGALQAVNMRRKELAQEDEVRAAERYRQNIRDASLAIAEHQNATISSGATPSPHDLKLWEFLDTVRLPHGPDSTPTSLRELVGTVWFRAEAQPAVVKHD